LGSKAKTICDFVWRTKSLRTAAQREEPESRVFGNRALRRKFPQSVEVTGVISYIHYLALVSKCK